VVAGRLRGVMVAPKNQPRANQAFGTPETGKATPQPEQLIEVARSGEQEDEEDEQHG